MLGEQRQRIGPPSAARAPAGQQEQRRLTLADVIDPEAQRAGGCAHEDPGCSRTSSRVAQCRPAIANLWLSEKSTWITSIPSRSSARSVDGDPEFMTSLPGSSVTALTARSQYSSTG